MQESERVLAELRQSLRGSRFAQRRLVEELEAHLDDAIADGGEAEAIARMGPPSDIAARWNELQLTKRRRARRTLAVVTLSIGCAGALAITQYAAGGSSHRPTNHPPRQHLLRDGGR